MSDSGFTKDGFCCNMADHALRVGKSDPDPEIRAEAEKLSEDWHAFLLKMYRKHRRAEEEVFIDVKTNATKLFVTLQLAQLVGTDAFTSKDFTWIERDVRILVDGIGIDGASKYIPFLYKEDGEIIVRWVKPILKPAEEYVKMVQKEWEMLEGMDSFEASMMSNMTQLRSGSSRAYGDSTSSDEEDGSRTTSNSTAIDTPTSSAVLTPRTNGL